MFIRDDFLLHSNFAEQLYHEFAASEPIVDYHTHLLPKEIAEDRQFQDLFEIWLSGDHYKWRLMRANGINETFCTGDATPYDKYLAWAKTLPHALGSPVYHWSHLELLRYFDIKDLLNPTSASAIWDQANARLKSGELSVRNILKRFRVQIICTTDDPVDNLAFHEELNRAEFETRVFPTFRPDRAFSVEDPRSFNDWVDQLSAITDSAIGSLDDFVSALKQRHEAFHRAGCRLSDHGLESCFDASPDERAAAQVFDRVRGGAPATHDQQVELGAYLMFRFTEWDAQAGWTKQLHLGAIRNSNRRALRDLGRDTGFDSIGDFPQIVSLARFLSSCEAEFGLPRMVLYNLNPAQNYAFATMAGNFQDGIIPGKIQFGAAWWFLDQKQGMEDQLRTLANVGLLSRFIGMLTDSRSFMSFPRHEYFRRILCNWLGEEMRKSELPQDIQWVGEVVQRICSHNALEFFNLS